MILIIVVQDALNVERRARRLDSDYLWVEENRGGDHEGQKSVLNVERRFQIRQPYFKMKFMSWKGIRMLILTGVMTGYALGEGGLRLKDSFQYFKRYFEAAMLEDKLKRI